MKHVSSNAANLYSTAEIHTFMCTDDFIKGEIIEERVIEIEIK